MLMNISAKFHACIRMCMIIVNSRSTRTGNSDQELIKTIRYYASPGYLQVLKRFE